MFLLNHDVLVTRDRMELCIMRRTMELSQVCLIFIAIARELSIVLCSQEIRTNIFVYTGYGVIDILRTKYIKL